METKGGVICPFHAEREVLLLPPHHGVDLYGVIHRGCWPGGVSPSPSPSRKQNERIKLFFKLWLYLAFLPFAGMFGLFKE